MACIVDLHKYRNGSTDMASSRGRHPEDILYFMDHIDFLDGCSRVLDAGCGSGNVVNWLQQKGVDARGVTYSDIEVKNGKKEFGVDLDIGDLHQLPYDDASFDAVICWDALEHCVAPLIVMSEIYRVLTDTGRLLLFVPGEDWIPCDYHVIVPSIKQTIHLCVLAGFKDINVTNYGTKGGGVRGRDSYNMAVYHIQKELSDEGSADG